MNQEQQNSSVQNLDLVGPSPFGGSLADILIPLFVDHPYGSLTLVIGSTNYDSVAKQHFDLSLVQIILPDVNFLECESSVEELSQILA